MLYRPGTSLTTRRLGCKAQLSMGLIHVFTVLLNRVDKILNRLRETFNHSRFAEYPHAGLYYSPAYALIEQKKATISQP